MDNLNAITWGENPAQTYRGFPIHITPRQRDVLLLLCEGLCNKRIGRRLGLSHTTVKSHVAGLLRALNVARRGEVVAAAHTLGLVRTAASVAVELAPISRTRQPDTPALRIEAVDLVLSLQPA